MMLHGNARSCPRSRRLLVERIESPFWSLAAAAAEADGVSERTAYRPGRFGTGSAWEERTEPNTDSGRPASVNRRLIQNLHSSARARC